MADKYQKARQQALLQLKAYGFDIEDRGENGLYYNGKQINNVVSPTGLVQYYITNSNGNRLAFGDRHSMHRIEKPAETVEEYEALQEAKRLAEERERLTKIVRDRKAEMDELPAPIRWFIRATMNAAMGENPAVMLAAGFMQDENGNFYQDPYSPGATELRNNLAVLGGTAASIIPIANAGSWMPWLSFGKSLGTLGNFIGGTTGAVAGTAIGTAADLGLAGYGVYNGASDVYFGVKNNNISQATLGGVEAGLSVLPIYLTTKGLRTALRASMADNIIPLGYDGGYSKLLTSNSPLGEFTREDLAIKTLKDMATRYTTNNMYLSKEATPYWRSRILYDTSQPYDEDIPILWEDILKTREDALRLAMKQPQRFDTYIPISGNKYLYNPKIKLPDKVLQDMGPNIGENVDIYDVSELNSMKPNEVKHNIFDSITTNGGFGNLKREGNVIYFNDRWDLLPFKDADRIAYGDTRSGKFMHRYLPNLEVVKLVGGNPFILKTPFYYIP